MAITTPVEVLYIAAIGAELTLVGIIKALQQSNHRRLAATGSPNKCDCGAGENSRINAPEGLSLRPQRIRELDILTHDVCAHGIFHSNRCTIEHLATCLVRITSGFIGYVILLIV